MAVLVTGGAGYIGSHTCIELIAAGFEPVVVDNFCNSRREPLLRAEKIAGKTIPCVEADVRDSKALADLFSRYDIDSVIHFAGLKAVGDSCTDPLTYYENNVAGTVTLCQVMKQFKVENFIFSSSATVYGEPPSSPIAEHFPTSPESPYGRSKLMVEEILQDLCNAPDNNWHVSLLRYFNPIGAHASGLIGEDPRGVPNNLLPYVAQVAVGKLPHLQVFGDDYNTIDGTGVRDYIHVVDLAKGHVKSLQYLLQQPAGCYTHNLGTGQGYSVLQVVKAFEDASGKAIAYKVAPRRPGDIAIYYADPSLAKQTLGWQAELTLGQMVADTWRWQSQNPNGYDK